MKDIDAADLRILSVLQDDGTLSVADVAERVHLSTNACWRRLRRLDTEGIIRKRVALIDAGAVGLSAIAFVRLRFADHHAKTVGLFVEMARSWDEVTEISQMAGDQALLLKTYCSSLAAHGLLIDRIVTAFPGTTVTSDFVMRPLYHTTALPI